MKITAAVTESTGGPFTLRTLDLEEPRPDEVRVRVDAVGICHSDLSMRDQFLPLPLPMVLGHEGAGIVDAVGQQVTSVRPGDRVLLHRNTCGRCAHCRAGRTQLCAELALRNMSGARTDGSTGLSLDGQRVSGQFFGQSSFATHVVAHERVLTPLPPDLPMELAPAFGCGVLTGAGAVLHGLRVSPGDELAVFGVGAVGLAAVMAARAAGATKIIAVDTNDQRLHTAIKLGATHGVLSTGGNVAGQVRAHAPTGVHHSIDTTGVPAVVRAAVDVLGAGGTCGLVGIGPAGTELTFDQMQLALLGVGVVGLPAGSCDPNLLLPTLFELHRQGRFPVEALVTTFAFTEVNAAVAAVGTGAVIKAVLLQGESPR